MRFCFHHFPIKTLPQNAKCRRSSTLELTTRTLPRIRCRFDSDRPLHNSKELTLLDFRKDRHPPDKNTRTPAHDEALSALDAFRGFIMFTLAAEGFGFSALTGDPTRGRVARWFDHVPWEGAAMPFALARRTELDATSRENFRHALTKISSPR